MKLFDRIAQACGDPGSYLPRRPDESVTRWSARAVAHVLQAPRPLEEWSEDDGPVLWWRLPVEEAPWVGTPLDDEWPCRWEEGWTDAMDIYSPDDAVYTHWTPLPWAPGEEPEVR